MEQLSYKIKKFLFAILRGWMDSILPPRPPPPHSYKCVVMMVQYSTKLKEKYKCYKNWSLHKLLESQDIVKIYLLLNYLLYVVSTVLFSVSFHYVYQQYCNTAKWSQLRN